MWWCTAEEAADEEEEEPDGEVAPLAFALANDEEGCSPSAGDAALDDIVEPNPATLAPSSSGIPPNRNVLEVESATSGWLYSDKEKSSLNVSASALLLPLLLPPLYVLPKRLAESRALLPFEDEVDDAARWDEDVEGFPSLLRDRELASCLPLLSPILSAPPAVIVEVLPLPLRAVMCSGPMSTTVFKPCLRVLEVDADDGGKDC